MNLQHINLDDLKVAALNVRKVGGTDVSDLEPSIRAHGLLQPLLVRPNCEGYEVIAGQRRYHALSRIADDSTVEPIPCLVMDKDDDAAAIEASLAENIARLPMDEIDQFKAFSVLVKQGQGVDDIASHFGITERLVKQRLAIANLLPPILTAYRKQDIDAATLRLLTMATKKQQKAWLVLYRSDDDHAPQGFRLKEWLFGGAQIPTSNALFDLTTYAGNVVSDLFGEDSYFDDADTFWAAQNTAIAAAKDTYLADGWTDVVVLDIGVFFASYEYEDTPKEEGGKVIVHVARDGEVTFHEGRLSRDEVKARQKAAVGDDVGQVQRPELTKAMQTYLDLHRHASVRVALLSHHGVALRVAVAQIIAGSSLWSTHAEPQTAPSDAIADSLSANKAEAKFATERQDIMALLGMEDADTIVPRKDDWSVSRDVDAIFARLTTLDDATVTRILTFVVAETLPSGSAMVETLGVTLNVDTSKDWAPDQTFFDLFRDKQAINAMLADVGGKTTADAHVASTAKVQKKIMQDYLDGTRTGGKADWHPRYMAFPMTSYTKRGGLNAMERWDAVKVHHV